MNGDPHAAGNKFAHILILVNPCVASIIGRPIKQARIKGTHPETIQELHSVYEDNVHWPMI